MRITYDPRVISYGSLLRILFSVVADPTLRNRQGPDRGPQYRAAIVPLDSAQREVEAAYLAQIGKGGFYARPIAAKIESYTGFYPAETYHQDFMQRHPRHAYIVRWDAPKLAAFKRLYPAWIRRTPAP